MFDMCSFLLPLIPCAQLFEGNGLSEIPTSASSSSRTFANHLRIQCFDCFPPRRRLSENAFQFRASEDDASAHTQGLLQTHSTLWRRRRPGGRAAPPQLEQRLEAQASWGMEDAEEGSENRMAATEPASIATRVYSESLVAFLPKNDARCVCSGTELLGGQGQPKSLVFRGGQGHVSTCSDF